MDYKKYSAEFIATFVFMLMVIGASVVTSSADWITYGVVYGGGFIALYFLFSVVSGCHMNPAVSLGMAINKRIDWIDFAIYVILQVLAGLLAALIVFLAFKPVVGGTAVEAMGASNYNTNFFQNGGNFIKDGKWYFPFIVEVVMTALIVMTFLQGTKKGGTAAKKAGVFIGLVIIVAVFFAFRISSASFNPARSIGPAIFSVPATITDKPETKYFYFNQLWLFVLAPMIGGAAAAFLDRLLDKGKESAE